MFGILKDKLKNFVDKLTKREEAKEEVKPVEPPAQKPTEPAPAAPKIEEIKPPELKPVEVHEPAPRPKPIEAKPVQRVPEPKLIEIKPASKAPEIKPEARPKLPEPKPVQPKITPKQEVKLAPQVTPLIRSAPVSVAPIAVPVGKSGLAETKKESKIDVRLSLESKVRSLFSSDVTIKEKDVDDLLEQLELDMLEADVAYEVAQALKVEIKNQLVGRRIGKGGMREAIAKSIEAALLSVMESEKPNVVELARGKGEKPFIILFLGPNGAGKTTTIAKFVNLMRGQGMTSVIALADTFRAASQEQGMHWAERVGAKAIGGAYGSDAAAVAFNAREHARSKGIDVVLIDSAGRQETSKNLMQELAKIVRVVKPDFKIYIGEAIAGNAVVEQVKEFDKYVGVDAVVLTKADVDAKGGAAISIYKATGKPILYLGVGQRESDLREFDANWVVGNILGEPRAG
ncbi:MAG: signal recognition particle-docking protein FtsY [Candidatus Burarchaeum sp.]|nr:signal recognition particle-docking protein FtsY [Candidatus Burarchaeum sp.]MDO8339461.1 signal recognition particle-docking protein FtsY [Candidatus Burarchaeum sp.]